MVLEARYNAEKIWYPVIWERAKESSDVIDYNINEEIAVDRSSVFNANNDTTTGMATVIPWVNAPKLIQTTSIYQNWEGTTWWVTASGSISLSRPDDTTWRVRTTWVLSNEYWNIKYNIRNEADILRNWLRIPVSWWYKLDITYPYWWSTFSVDVDIEIAKWWRWNDETIVSHIGQYNTSVETETVTHQFSAWDCLFAYLTLNYRWSSSAFFWTFNITMTITKL